MQRRRLLLATGTAFLGGCASGSPDRAPAGQPSTTVTATPPETITDCREFPTPPDEPTRERAREFVASHEEALVYNWLVSQNGGPNDCRPDETGSSASSAGATEATEVNVEPATTAVTADADPGFYVVSSCSGDASYWCPDQGRSCSGASRNAHFVTHYVGDGRHVRVPDNWTSCDVRDEPYRSSDAAENVSVPDGEPAMTFRVYDFDGGRAVDVVLTHLDAGETVLSETYEPPRGPAVQSNVTVRRGDYRLTALVGDRTVSHEFSLTGRDDSAWNGLRVYLGPDGDLRVVEVATNGDFAGPDNNCFRFRDH